VIGSGNISATHVRALAGIGGATLAGVYGNIAACELRLERYAEGAQYLQQSIAAYDDLDMPIGSVRNRLRGGAGGHRGVASILEAFQTDGFRRVKIGMRPPEAVVDPLEYVLAPIDAASRAAVDVAIAAAGSRVLEMTRRRSSHQSRVGES